MVRPYRLFPFLIALLAVTAVGRSQGTRTTLPPPPVASLGTPIPSPNPAPAFQAESPGSKVVWRETPQLRGVPAGLSTFLADVEGHLPREMGMQYRDSSRITWCHETTHGIHSALRNKHRLPAFYTGGGKFALVEPPALTLGEVAAAVPVHLRGMRYQTYLVKARRDWESDPLYVWDEWVAYNNGTTTGIEEAARAPRGASDDAVACLEMSGYALAVAAAARRKGVPVSGQFREFLASELRRSLGLYSKAMTLPAFAWNDQRLAQAWLRRDPFIVDELRVLYGESLTVRDLLR